MDKILETEHGIFTSNEVTGQTAKEVYQWWLANKDKPVEPPVDKIIVLSKQLCEMELEMMRLRR